MIALRDIQAPMFAVATETDYIAPWQSVYKLHLFTDNEVQFVLTNGGHNAGIVSEPGHPGRYYHFSTRRHGERYADAQAWLAQAKRAEGSWWPQWSSWLAERSDPQRVDPPAMGAPEHNLAPLCHAPGTYVHQH